ncbi:YdcF family protein [Lysobacter enzymogenes]|uniref:YdcF family protein n=1 Tax=Lysobacter enzymogenes TaxID=69 RepID=A0A3N2RGC2_LYSEN|nr:YdcF family protein [Lysobacter enzymogenes]ROU06502.1 YdcF family protein [Lysobacter enzymogenes]
MSAALAAAWLTQPLNASAVALALAALVWLLHWRRCALALGALALAWSLLWSLPAAAGALRDSLQRGYLGQSAEGLPQADVIVVLGGGIGRVTSFDGGDADAPELAGNRVAAAARAWQAGRAPAILVSGGASTSTRGISEAAIMADALVKLGVPREALVLEDGSRDTRGNAERSARIAAERGWRRAILVTSALHMPRALQWFERAGLPALPLAPPAGDAAPGTGTWTPSMRTLDDSAQALHEYAGLMVATFD